MHMGNVLQTISFLRRNPRYRLRLSHVNIISGPKSAQYSLCKKASENIHRQSRIIRTAFIHLYQQFIGPLLFSNASLLSTFMARRLHFTASVLLSYSHRFSFPQLKSSIYYVPLYLSGDFGHIWTSANGLRSRFAPAIRTIKASEDEKTHSPLLANSTRGLCIALQNEYSSFNF